MNSECFTCKYRNGRQSGKCARRCNIRSSDRGPTCGFYHEVSGCARCPSWRKDFNGLKTCMYTGSPKYQSHTEPNDMCDEHGKYNGPSEIATELAKRWKLGKEQAL